MVGDLFLEPEVYKGLCLQPLSAGNFRHLAQYLIRDLHFVHATLQVHVKVHRYHVLFIIGAAVGVPEFASLFQTVEVVWQRIYLLLTFSHTAYALFENGEDHKSTFDREDITARFFVLQSRERNNSGETPKNSPRFFSCSLLGFRLPLTTSETRLREPSTDTKSA